MSKQITPEMVDALNTLRVFARMVKVERCPAQMDKETAEAIDLLDNADFFTAIDDVSDPV